MTRFSAPLVALLLLGGVELAVAQPVPGLSTDQQKQLPANCIDVQLDDARSYDCVNAQMHTLVQGQPRPSAASDAPYSATSPSQVTGQFNESATRNRLGTNFGKSVTPSGRPTAPPAPAIPR